MRKKKWTDKVTVRYPCHMTFSVKGDAVPWKCPYHGYAHGGDVVITTTSQYGLEPAPAQRLRANG